MNREILKVSNNTEPGKLAGAITAVVRDGKNVEVQSIGPKAISQAVKAVAIARGFLAPAGIDLVMYPAFQETTLENGETRTSIAMFLEKR